ncbi:transcriptional regulator NrdR family protein [Paracidovorax wautersii]|uniref:Transcriptional regulator NrdR family protein n=1 Tax=Paracidovorax wautersii TaxID=1177982 RepID=A0ABU1IG50_9BURK|nr:transcriptional regulator NrdR family protein [Paracidovorax wautersii]
MRPKYRPPPCPECGAWSEVLETRRRHTGVIARRHECANLHRFTTHEKVTEKEAQNAQ